MAKKAVVFECAPPSVAFRLVLKGQGKSPGADGKVTFSVEPGRAGLAYAALGAPGTPFSIALASGGTMAVPIERKIPADGDTGGFRKVEVQA